MSIRNCLILILTLGALVIGRADAASVMLDETPRIAVVSAYAPEAERLKRDIKEAKVVTLNGVEFTMGKLAGKDVVLLLSGISMVNAAMTSQLLLDHFEVSAIVVSGIAGGVDSALHIGDVAVPERWGQYLEAVFARERLGGFDLPPWAEKAFPNHGMIFPQPVEVRRDGDLRGTKQFWFQVDPGMLAAAKTLEGKIGLARCTAEDACLDQNPKIQIGGNGVSGQAFVDNAGFRQYVQTAFQAKVLDMESAAIATVAYANGVPFLAFRSLSDLAGGGPDENELGTFFQLAADNSAAVVIAFLGAWTPPR